DPFFDTCRLSVAPLRYGAGVKGKINQSLAHGLPVVTTSQGAEGMYLRDGESALIADDPSTFAAAMVQLYQDSKLWRRLSSGGLAVMETHFSFGAARQAILGAIHE
ncbi:MAG: glycosyltransferase family 4 protein, partial [Thiohalocapsa sp.]